MVFPLGGHLVAETPDSTGETTVLTCIRCGLTASLTDSEKMAKTECKQQDIKAEQEANKETEQQQKPKCITCGRPATTAAPFWDVVTMDIQMKNVCWECHGDFLKLLRKGPEIRPRVYGRGRGYYFQPLNTWFEEMAGTWPCPACEEFFESFSEVVNHFAEKHPDKSKPLEEIEVDINGKKVKAYRCWQGIYCPCGYLTNNENHFRHHYRREHPEAMR